MRQPLRVLLVEDNALDIDLALMRLEVDGFDCAAQRVDTADGLRRALEATAFDVVLADFVLPTFSGPEALAIVRAFDADLPFIFLSGMLGEENAVDMLKQGATDYVLKQRLTRLPAVVMRALGERDVRRQRTQAERALRRTETHFRQLIDALKDYAVLSLDPSGAISTWNTAAKRLLGYEAQEIVGRRPDIFLSASEREDGLFDAELEQARTLGSCSDDRWLWCKDGHSVFASIVTTAIRDERGALLGFSKIIRDTTEARMAADALRVAKEQAETANQAKDHFLAVLSHELRTPLTPILAAVRLIQVRHQQGLPEIAGQLDVIRRNVELEARLIDDLLDLTSISRGKLSLNFEPIDIASLVDHVVDMSADDIASKRLALSVSRGADATRVSGDAARVQQIVWNLLRNAVKFTPTGGSVSIALSNPGDETVAVTVRDTGIGIEEAALPRIFSAFEQADDSIRRSFGGLGLGLAIANTLALKHGGTLSVASPGPGQGATFTLSLPILPEQTAPAALDAGPSNQQKARALKILLVEDNEDTAFAMASLLEIDAHEVSVAASVADAHRHIDAGPFDLLISDIGLPDGTGLDIVTRWRERRGAAPSIAITGYGMEEDVRRSREAGFSDHLTKPVSFERLGQLIAALTA
ncbi:hybrid sensor histidine kinase/response regulator [Chitinasiproducens palmae]|uniref:histidine kinase n=1 Tax=Chitinasiproducens palmae TaxID=1770053 RepID=A0A1H2PW38_9BURK|nr:response regulator [Chitinasiproducens palmae]SDV51591.1 PAS domain S-box-containing protein [Chitinasiproducens palmae]